VTPGPAACMPGHAFQLCLLSCCARQQPHCSGRSASHAHTSTLSVPCIIDIASHLLRGTNLSPSPCLHRMLTYVQSGQWRPPTQIRRIQGANFFKISSQLPNHIMSLPPAVPIQTIHSGAGRRAKGDARTMDVWRACGWRMANHGDRKTPTSGSASFHPVHC
jgi:hypothetical protein